MTVNDIMAERGVALTTEFNGLLTSQDEQFKALIHFVAEQEKLHPN